MSLCLVGTKGDFDTCFLDEGHSGPHFWDRRDVTGDRPFRTNIRAADGKWTGPHPGIKQGQCFLCDWSGRGIGQEPLGTYVEPQSGWTYHVHEVADFDAVDGYHDGYPVDWHVCHSRLDTLRCTAEQSWDPGWKGTTNHPDARVVRMDDVAAWLDCPHCGLKFVNGHRK